MRDPWGDFSSGALFKLFTFLAAAVIANFGIFLVDPNDFSQLVTVVGVFLTAAGGAQIAAAIQGGTGTAPAVAGAAGNPRSFLQNAAGFVDSGRLMKLLSLLVSFEIAILVVLFIHKDSLSSVAKLSGAFLALSTATDIAQKVSGT